jgi:TolA-binding protein
MHAHSAESRRRRAVVGAAAGFALIVLVFSFPFSTLLSQHRQLTAAAAQLATVRQENHQLQVQQKQLSSKTEIERRVRRSSSSSPAPAANLDRRQGRPSATPVTNRSSRRPVHRT